MQDLKVIGVEDGALVAATEQGDRFRIVINDVLLSHLKPPREPRTEEKKLSPREIQAHIRAGLSADEVAELTGATLEYIERFEGPVLAEREHIVGAALAVPVLAAIEVPEGEEPTFGAAIEARLEGLDATGERWTSWKEPAGDWIVKVTFTAESIDHDARWTYEPKKRTLSPLNREAVTLSQQGDLPRGLVPRLRAVEADETAPHPEPPEEDQSRFDSGAFRVRPVGDADDRETIALLEPAALSPRHPSAASRAAVSRQEGAGESTSTSNQTADLLEALRKRRGRREAAPHPEEGEGRWSEESENQGSSQPEGADHAGDAASDTTESDETSPSGRRGGSRHRKGRASMPSWDEIVFGAKPDSDQ